MTCLEPSAFELQSLDIARGQLWAYWIADGIAAFAFLAVVVGAALALKSLRASQWNTLLLFEQDMAHRREKFQELGARLTQSLQDGPEPRMLQLMYNEAKESYFNSLDRLASSIIKGHFPDPEMKLDYHEALAEVVREFPKDFDTGTHYRKVVKLYNRWQDQA
jgi:hypothetical protein